MKQYICTLIGERWIARLFFSSPHLAESHSLSLSFPLLFEHLSLPKWVLFLLPTATLRECVIKFRADSFAHKVTIFLSFSLFFFFLFILSRWSIHLAHAYHWYFSFLRPALAVSAFWWSISNSLHSQLMPIICPLSPCNNCSTVLVFNLSVELTRDCFRQNIFLGPLSLEEFPSLLHCIFFLSLDCLSALGCALPFLALSLFFARSSPPRSLISCSLRCYRWIGLKLKLQHLSSLPGH